MSFGQTDTEQLFEAVRGWVNRHYPGLAVEELSVKLSNQRKVKLPAPLQFPNASERSGCAEDILTVVREAGHRMTTSQIMDELERRNMLWGERTVKGALAVLVQEGKLTNDQNARPRGYGIPEE